MVEKKNLCKYTVVKDLCEKQRLLSIQYFTKFLTVPNFSQT